MVRLTQRESVANLHETVSGLRMTSHLYAIGVDKTQSIALDEIFGKKTPEEIEMRSTRVFRKTRITQTATIKEVDEDVPERNSVQGEEAAMAAMLAKEDELIEVPVGVTRGGLCGP
jgi:NADH:ubiquinone oxidoreductase subunit D